MLDKNERDESQTLSSPYEGLAPDEYIEDPFADIDRSKLNPYELQELDMAEAQFRRSLLRPMFRAPYIKKRTKADEKIHELGGNKGEKGDWTVESKEGESNPKGIKKLAASIGAKVKSVFHGKQKPKERTFEEQFERDKRFIRIVHMDDDEMTQDDLDFLKEYRKESGLEGCGPEGC